MFNMRVSDIFPGKKKENSLHIIINSISKPTKSAKSQMYSAFSFVPIYLLPFFVLFQKKSIHAGVSPRELTVFISKERLHVFIKSNHIDIFTVQNTKLAISDWYSFHDDTLGLIALNVSIRMKCFQKRRLTE